MPFPHIVKVFNPLCLIQKLRNVIDKLLVENRKLANENSQLKLQLLCVSDKLSREIKKHSKATAIINDLKWKLEDCDEYLEYLKSQIEEKDQSIYDLESLLKKRDQLINDQANEIASSNKLIRDIYVLLLESRKCDF